MSSFFPRTTIYLCKTGIDDFNKYYFTSNSEAAVWCYSQGGTSFSEYSYQRADERQYCAVNADIGDIQDVDTIVFQNTDHVSAGVEPYWFIGNITQLEWKNPNTVWVWFKIDPYMTYCQNIDWDTSYCFVEREHVDDDWTGGEPNYKNCGVSEPLSIEPSLNINTEWFSFDFSNYLIVIYSPYVYSGGQVVPVYGGSITGNVYTGLRETTFTSYASANEFLQAVAEDDEADISNIVSILTIPSVDQSTVYAPDGPWTLYSDIYNAKCFSGQFCSIKVASPVGDSKLYNPEYFSPNASGDKYFFRQYTTRGAGVWGVILEPYFYGENFIGSSDDYNNGFFINEMPSGVVIGNNYAQWYSLNGSYTIASAVTSAVSTISGMATGNSNASLIAAQSKRANASAIASNNISNNVIQGAASLFQTYLDTAQAFKQAKMYGVSMLGDSNTTANLAAANDRYGYSIGWIGPRSNDLYALDDYFSRYGYQVNRLKVPNRDTRPHWNYVKCGEAHVAGDMPYNYRTAINNMLVSGVTFWNTDTAIGDYSDKAGNSNR